MSLIVSAILRSQVFLRPYFFALIISFLPSATSCPVAKQLSARAYTSCPLHLLPQHRKSIRMVLWHIMVAAYECVAVVCGCGDKHSVKRVFVFCSERKPFYSAHDWLRDAVIRLLLYELCELEHIAQFALAHFVYKVCHLVFECKG